MGLAGDGTGRSVTDAVVGTGPGQLEPAENQQELQPTACRDGTQPKGCIVKRFTDKTQMNSILSRSKRLCMRYFANSMWILSITVSGPG